MFLPLQFLRNHLFMFSMTGMLYFGWMNRDDNYLSAETGIGYLLGIIGGSLMIVLLLYPLSKRIKILTKWIHIRYWFGIHMLFGIIGPLMILFHSNFHIGSMNSSIALTSMLLVAGSGLIGRYIYTHIYHGLYGSRISLNEIRQETENNHRELLDMYEQDETLNQRLTAMEDKALQPHRSLIKSIFHVIHLTINSHQIKTNVKQLIKDSYKNSCDQKNKPDSKIVIQSIQRYTFALRHAAAFKLYEHLFSLWHVLHLPLFFMMIITAVIHIFAVHMY